MFEGGRRAVFLDRDGVLIRTDVRNGRPFARTRLEDMEILSGVVEGIAALKSSGFATVIVTNQPDVAAGKADRAAIEAMNRRLVDSLAIDMIETCYHGDGDGCSCRKPAPGMLRRAAQRLDIDLGRSVMVGDRWRDVDAGHNAGCVTIFIDLGYSESLRMKPNHVVPDFPRAVELILSLYS